MTEIFLKVAPMRMAHGSKARVVCRWIFIAAMRREATNELGARLVDFVFVDYQHARDGIENAFAIADHARAGYIFRMQSAGGFLFRCGPQNYARVLFRNRRAARS